MFSNLSFETIIYVLRNMKGTIKLLSLTITLLLGASLVVVNSKNVNFVKEADAYSTSSLPTTIDLNDTTPENIRSYYSSLNSLDESERQGTNLLKNLKTILKNGQKYYNYDSGNTVWQIYEISDRDWVKSPASSTTYGTYNSNTNKITGYTYGSSKSNSKNNPYIHALYINRTVENQTTAWDNHNQDEWGINREHVWPKAEGFEEEGAGGARGDPMHLMAGNGYSNNIHSNYYYGYVKTTSTYVNCGTKYSNQNGNLRGTSKTLNSGTVFEPQDSDKGDIARAIFYMVARYNYLSGNDSDGIDSNNPNLELTQNIADWSSSAYSSTTSRTGKMGVLTDLLAWHHADPVDAYEIHRNNLLYTNYTNNRNPFIDFPEWVDYIWGTATYNGSTYKSYNSTPTGVATPSSDTINGYNGGVVEPAVNSVTVSPSTLSLTTGETSDLSATVSVSGGAAQTVTWSSNNTGVATVSNTGHVTAVATGNATITATSTADNTKSGTCTVTVSAPSSGTKTDVLFAKGFGSYTTSEYGAAGTDYTGVANSTNATSSTYALQVFNGDTGAVRGNKSGANNFSARNTTTYSNYYISSVSLTVSGGSIDGSTNGRSLVYFGSSAYTNPNTTAPSGTSTTASPASSDQATLTWTNSNKNYNYFILYNLKTSGTALSENSSTALRVTWTPKAGTLTSVSVSGQTSTFVEGDTYSFGGTVTAHYSDGSTSNVTASSTFTGYDMTELGNQTVTVSYGGKTTSYDITVNEGLLDSISISGYTTTFDQNDTFIFDGSCTASFENGYSREVNPTSITDPDMSTYGNKTITVSYTYNGRTRTATYNITVNQVVVDNHGVEPNDPFSVEEALEKCVEVGEVASTTKYYTFGIISQISYFNTKYNNINFYISDDGTTTNQMYIYGCYDLNGVSFSSISDLSVGMKVIIYGKLQNYKGNTKEYTAGCYIYEYMDDAVTPELSITMSEQGYSNAEAVELITFYNANTDSINATFDKGTNKYNGPKYYTTGSSLRLYAGNTMTITSTKVNLTSIILTFGSGEDSNEITTNVGNYSDGAWTGTASSVTFTIDGENGQRRISSITITYFGLGDYVNYFLANTGCNALGTSAPTGDWDDFSDKFDILFTEDQNALQNALANQNGNNVQQAAARYDYIVKKYKYTNFISRDGLSSNDVISSMRYTSQDSYTIVIIISVLSISSLIGLLFFKVKTKEE